MTAGKDVTSVRWEPVGQGGSGEVTIEHDDREPLTISMSLGAARRLVQRLLGADVLEVSFPEDGFRWGRKSFAFTSADLGIHSPLELGDRGADWTAPVAKRVKYHSNTAATASRAPSP